MGDGGFCPNGMIPGVASPFQKATAYDHHAERYTLRRRNSCRRR